MNWKFVFVIFLFVLGFRLWFALQSDLSPDAYFELRQIEHVEETGLPLIHDDLSYGGRDNVVFPAFYYVLALFARFFTLESIAIIVPNLLASSLVILVYFISYDITKNVEASLFSSFISGFIPLFLESTLNTVSSISLQIPLAFLLIYCFMRLNSNWSVYIFMTLSFILPILHNSTYMLVLGFLVYMAFSYIENFQFKDKSYEFSLFFLFVSLWLITLVTKKAMVAHGTGVFWQNIPSIILVNYFSDLTLQKVIGGIGILNLLIGVYVLQRYLFNYKNRDVYLLTSFAVSVCVLLAFKLINLVLGLSFLAIILVIFFSMFYDICMDFIKKSHFSTFSKVFVLLLVLAFAFNSVVPSISVSSNLSGVNKDYVAALEWAYQNTDSNATILAPLEFGHAVNYIAKRKNVADSQFMLIPLAEQRARDIREFYSSNSGLNKVEIMNFYNAKYAVADTLNNISDGECFELIYDSKVKIYKLLCETRVERL